MTQEVLMVTCTGADKCGFRDCPCAKLHNAYDDLCTESLPCQQWQQRKGIGKKKSECQCVPKVEQ